MSDNLFVVEGVPVGFYHGLRESMTEFDAECYYVLVKTKGRIPPRFQLEKIDVCKSINDKDIFVDYYIARRTKRGLIKECYIMHLGVDEHIFDKKIRRVSSPAECFIYEILKGVMSNGY